jgi:transglutaminase-like putative cysteine protease
MFAVFLSLISFGIPSLYQKLNNQDHQTVPYQREYSTSWEVLRNFLFPLRQQAGFGEGGFDPVLALGTSRSLKDDQVLQINVPDELYQNTRFYWRGRAYTTYQNGYWQNVDELIEIEDNPIVNPYPSQFYKTGSYLYIYEIPSKTIFTPMIAIQVEKPAQVSFFLTENGNWDVIAVTDPNLVRSGESVLVKGAINQPSLSSLRQAGTDYPDWVVENYLDVPTGLSGNIHALAEDVTAKDSTVFDKAMTLTNFLRNTYKYQNYVKIPQDVDPLEWFLFQGKAGFCNYFASAEVIMLRSIGIPARFVVGYAQGDRMPDKSAFSVQMKDSHAWVEVFFPNIGWVILEPTPLQPNMEYVEMVAPDSEIDPHERFALQEEGRNDDNVRAEFERVSEKYTGDTIAVIEDKFDIREVVPWLIFLLLVPFLIWVYVKYFILSIQRIRIPVKFQEGLEKRGKKSPGWLKSWAGYESLMPVQKMYARIKYFSKLTAFKEETGETPREFMRHFFNHIQLECNDSEFFLEEFHQRVYGKQPLSVDDDSDQELLTVYRRIMIQLLQKIGKNLGHEAAFRIKLLRIR